MPKNYQKKTLPKAKPKKRKEGQGRPCAINEDVLGKLNYAFSIGCSDGEACLYAGINPTTLYEYQSKHPEFTERKKLLKEKVPMRARLNIVKDIEEGNMDTSKWFLERKKKDEFSTKQEVETFEKKFTSIKLVGKEEVIELK